jgi:hypothetical protein
MAGTSALAEHYSTSKFVLAARALRTYGFAVVISLQQRRRDSNLEPSSSSVRID